MFCYVAIFDFRCLVMFSKNSCLKKIGIMKVYGVFYFFETIWSFFSPFAKSFSFFRNYSTDVQIKGITRKTAYSLCACMLI